MATRGRALVLDGHRVHALDIVRTLGQAGITVSVAASHADAIAFSSRYASRCEVYPDPAVNADEFLDWLERLLAKGECDLVIPVTDVTVVPISRNLARLQRFCAMAAQPFEVLEQVTDKRRTLDLARRVGVPCPATVVVHSEAELDRHASGLRFPVVCKPMASGVWSAHGYVGLQVFYALDEQELRREVARRLPTCPVMLQEYRRGAGVGVEVLARDGKILQAFQHQRLHELPLTGGGSTYRTSVPLDPVLLDYAGRLLGAIGWTGVAMVEFRVDVESGDVALMEINGRFWGSLPLSSRAGMAFAADLFDMLARGATPASRPYRSGVRCRKLRDDVEWFKEAWKLEPAHPYVRAGLISMIPRTRLCADAMGLLSPREHYDVQVLSDLRPGLRDLRDTVVAQLVTVRKRVRSMQSKVHSALYRVRTRARLVPQARAARNLLFVCYGNIMRSPFASGYLAVRGGAERRNLQARSAGYYDRTGRPADARAVAAGRRWGVDLSSHSSRKLDEDLIAWADLIFVMDRPNLAAVRRLYPDAAGKTYLLGSLDADAPDVEISDPYHCPYEATEHTYVRIAGAIDRLVACGGSAEVRP